MDLPNWNDENANFFVYSPPAPSRPTATRISFSEENSVRGEEDDPFYVKPLNLAPKRALERKGASKSRALRRHRANRHITENFKNPQGGVRTTANTNIEGKLPELVTLMGGLGIDEKKVVPTRNFVPQTTKLNVVIVGDSRCGKSTLLESFTKQYQKQNQVLMTYEKSMTIDRNQQIEFTIWDLSGHSDFDRLRPLAYASADGILCCCSIDDLQSFNNIKERWLPELEMYCQNCPMILVGLKSDLRKKEFHMNVPIDTCQSFAASVRLMYLECTAREQNTAFIFKKLARMVIKKQSRYQNHHETSNRKMSLKSNLETQLPMGTSSPISTALARTAVLNCSRPLTSHSSFKAHSISNQGKRRTMSMSSKLTLSSKHEHPNIKRVTRMDSVLSLRTSKKEKCTIM